MPDKSPDFALVSDYDYLLPENLIAQSPLTDRAASRLMFLRGKNAPEHRSFSELPDLLRKGDCLVYNDTRVIPARLFGQIESGAAMEMLLLKQLGPNLWSVIGKPGKKMRPGTRITILPERLEAVVRDFAEDGEKIVEFIYDGIWEEILDEAGLMPLPPYIHEKLDDPERYQTVYARIRGSAAAPTAGLHFTDALMDELRSRGIFEAKLTLHVGLGTFRPVKEKEIARHKMHSEDFSLDEKNAEQINRCRAAGGRVIAVGTTSCRVLESLADERGLLRAASGATDIFIYPGYRFKILDGLITNFHLPKSTLLMLVAALMGRERILAAYGEAIRENYRFFSFGDAMLLLP